jgi:hypothetical protein
MNVGSEYIKTIYFNADNSSVVIVSLWESERYGRLRCRYYLLDNLTVSFDLFGSELIRNPGFIEFDDVNRRIVTRSEETRTFKLWYYTDYSLALAI